MIIEFKKLDPKAVIPEYQTPGASGFDFHAVEAVKFAPGETKVVKTGLACRMEGSTNGLKLELQVRPRGGMTLKTPMRVANSPGTVDRDYRGEIGIIMQNTGSREHWITVGERVAQGVICPVYQCQIAVIDELDETERGSGAYGSTGSH